MIGDPSIVPGKQLWELERGEPPLAREKEKPWNEMALMDETTKSFTDAITLILRNEQEQELQQV